MLRQFIVWFSVAFVIMCLIINYQKTHAELKYVTSTVDGNEYMVRNLPDCQKAADILAQLRQRMVKLADHVHSIRDEQDEFCMAQIEQLRARFKPDKLCESPSGSAYTSYSVGKGEKVFMCLRNKETNDFIDFNTLIFVAIHEQSHIKSSEVGHTQQFWSNFTFLLREAVKIGVYDYVDYSVTPVQYCGMTITSTPYNPSTDDVKKINKTPNTHQSCR